MSFIAYHYPKALVRVVATVQLSRTQDQTEQVTFWVTPRSVSLERNDYNTADQVTIVFDAMRFPVLPRLIRQALIEVYFGDAGTIDSPDDPIADPALLRFIGYIDNPELELSEDDGTVTWKARDYTALLLDVRRPLTASIPSYNDGLDVALRRIIDLNVPNGQNIGLELRGLDAWPALSTARPSGLSDAKIPTRPDDTAWMLVKRACDPVALIPQIILDKLVVSTSRGLAQPKSQAVFVYGANLTGFIESRNLQKIKEGIGLRAYDLSTRTYIISQFPPAGDARVRAKQPAKHAVKKRAKPPPAIDPHDKRAWFPYPDVANQAALDDAAERIYNERSRQEFEGSFTFTRMLVPDASVDDISADYDGVSFDATTLTNGDRVILDVLPEQRAVLGDIDSTDGRIAYLQDQGYESDVAATLVDVFESGVSGPIEVYVRKANYTLSDDIGFSCKIDFQNLIVGA